ncbi:MAG: sigma factor-like helix-turn-helix DNA-binding protein [Patescibacteria group bacterium]
MSILDQVRKNQFQEKLAGFNPVETLNTLFARLSEKEKEVVKRRFALGYDEKHTLEEIGQLYSITRERVRQIENLSVKKLKELRELRDQIEEAEKVVANLLEQYGGVMEEDFFLENILSYLEAQEDSANTVLFLAEHIFSDNVSKVKQNKEFNNLWQTGSADIEMVKAVINEIVKMIEEKGEPLKLEDLLTHFKNSEFYRNNKDKFLSAAPFLEATEEDIDRILESYLRASRKIKQDLFNNWGLISWGIVQPKKINDKIYVTLKKANKPLHFTEIASFINENRFDEKIAYAPTVHNELILDDKYVLVGRGIYALKEWGYKPGTVAEVVGEILKENGPLAKNEIMEKVLEKRNVKNSTVYLSLMNNEKIKRTEDGKYTLVEQ